MIRNLTWAVRVVVVALFSCGSSWAAVEETGVQTLDELLLQYRDRIAQIDPLIGMTESETLDWIHQIENSLAEEPNSQYNQSALVAIMSLWNWLHSWDEAHSVCQRAITVARDEETRLERLMDRFAIEHARDRHVERGTGLVRDERMQTYDEIRHALERFGGGERDRVLSEGRFLQYIWVMETAAKIAAESGEAAVATVITDQLGSFLRENKRFERYGLEATVKHHSGVAAGAFLVMGDIQSAIRVLHDNIEVGIRDVLLETRIAYDLASSSGEISFMTLHKFLLAVPFPDCFESDALNLAIEHGYRCLKTIASSVEHGTYQPVEHADGVLVRDVIAIIEMYTSKYHTELLSRQDGAFPHDHQHRDVDPSLSTAYKLLARLYGVMGDAGSASQYRREADRITVP